MMATIAATVAASIVGLVALLMLIREHLRPGRKGERVELTYGYFERLHDIDDCDNPF